jgi:hypothetical protein
VHQPRFVFLSTKTTGQGATFGASAEGMMWLLISPNNRGLGRSSKIYSTYSECRTAVADLQRECKRVRPHTTVDDITGHFTWRVELGDETVANSTRSYLRARECGYNLARFLESLPKAGIADGARSFRVSRNLQRSA